MPKWPTSWKDYSGDIQPTEKVIQAVRQDEDKFPFAIVTPDGEWHEQGKMGWFGVATNEESFEAWNKRAIGLLMDNANTTAVVVDCHI